VIREGSAQSGAFYRAVKRLNPRAQVFARLDHSMHGWAFKYDHGLPAMIRFLLAHRMHGPPAGGFAYSSWEPRATVWGWHVRALDPGKSLWSIWDVTPAGFDTEARIPLLVRPPERAAVSVPAGRHRVTLDSVSGPVGVVTRLVAGVPGLAKPGRRQVPVRSGLGRDRS